MVEAQESTKEFSFPVKTRRPSIQDLAMDPHVFTLANPPKTSDKYDKNSMAHATRYKITDLPKYELPEDSLDPRTAYRLVIDEMSLDGNPTLNLATFVTTWMEDEAMQLVMHTVGKNMADHNIYPQTIEIQNRCVQILARLFNSTEVESKEQDKGPELSTFHSAASSVPEVKGTGTCCIGSSEALMLCALALKKKWAHRRREQGKPFDKPNLIMSSSVQVAWKKFCCYFDVEPKFVPLAPDRFVMDIDMALDLADENTIGIVMMLGSTYTGHYEPIEEMNDALLKLNEEKGWDIGIHVDAASGGFIAPFMTPELKWDFRLPLVKSINVSGHKYGLVYPGIGWALWREKSDLPADMVFDLHYLGGVESTASLNFSRPASQMILQYYNFLRLGREGYKNVMENCRANANYLTQRLEEMEVFDILSDDVSVPLVAFKLKDEITDFTVYDLASKLRESGWILPAYSLSEGAEDVQLLRAVMRESFSQDLAELLCRSLAQAIAYFKEKARTKESIVKRAVATKLQEAHPEEFQKPKILPESILHKFFAGLRQKLPKAGESVC